MTDFYLYKFSIFINDWCALMMDNRKMTKFGARAHAVLPVSFDKKCFDLYFCIYIINK